MRKLRAAVIGLGRIGMGYDYKERGNKVIATHAMAFAKDPAFQLVGAVDPDKFRRKAFTKKYSKLAFENIDELFKKTSPEVIALAVPTKFHAPVFARVIKYRPKAVILEKPLAHNLVSAGNIPVLVNYPRRFEPGANQLKELIRSGGLGEIYKGVVWYSKGILNNGSHYIDLLLWLLGDATELRVINKGRLWDKTDPEPDFVVKFGKAEVFFLACREEKFSIVDMELIGTKGKVSYANFGLDIQYWPCVSDPVYPGYTILGPKSKRISSDLHRSQLHVQRHLAQYLSGKKKDLISSTKTALRTMEIINDILSKRGAKR